MNQEKMRLCPSCRMEIPVLAVKCRFCGEEVGRPRDESRKLSINDLGGETIQPYAPSGSVIDAMEAYRAEIQAEQEAAEEARRKPRKSFFSRRRPPQQAAPPPPQVEHKAPPPPTETALPPAPLTAADFTTPSSRHAAAPPADPTWVRKTAFFGAFVAIAVILVLGGFQVLAVVQDIWGREEVPGPSGFVNRAPAIIQRGGPPLEALEAAAEALTHDQTNRNREIAERAAQLVAEQVEGFLQAADWQPENVLAASQLAHQASDLYSSDITRRIREIAKEEVFLYQMNLVSADRDAGTAVLSVTARDGRRERVGIAVGATLHGRFIVQRVWDDRVVLEDTQRLARHGRKRTVTVRRTGVD